MDVPTATLELGYVSLWLAPNSSDVQVMKAIRSQGVLVYSYSRCVYIMTGLRLAGAPKWKHWLLPVVFLAAGSAALVVDQRQIFEAMPGTCKAGGREAAANSK